MLRDRSSLDGWRRSALVGGVGSLALAASFAGSLIGGSGGPGLLPASASAPVVRQATPSGWCVPQENECAGVNLYGSSGSASSTSLVPGGSVTSRARFDADGSGATGIVLDPSTCTATTAEGRPVAATEPNLCAVLRLTLYRGPRPVGAPAYQGTLAGFDAPMFFRVVGDPVFTVVVHLPASATSEVQGQRVSQPLSWSFRR